MCRIVIKTNNLFIYFKGSESYVKQREEKVFIFSTEEKEKAVVGEKNLGNTCSCFLKPDNLSVRKEALSIL